MSFINTFILTVSFIAVAGCASTGVMKTGEDQYTISKISLQVGFGAPTAVYAEISEEATDFCAKQSKVLDIINTDIKMPAVGQPGSATLKFRCKVKD